MPKEFFNLQLFAEEGSAAGTEGAANPTADVATAGEAEGVTDGSNAQIATATDGGTEENFDSLIKGRYKKDYDAAVRKAIERRFKNQQNLQGQLDSYKQIAGVVASRYGIEMNPDGSIPIDALNAKILEDDSIYEKEAYDRGMNVKDLRELKTLEMENRMLKARAQQSDEQREWEAIVSQVDQIKQVYPEFDLDTEMTNPNFGRLLATMQRSGFPNAVQTAYEAIHRDEIMGGAMRYAVKQTQEKISNSIQSGMNRPNEGGMSNGMPAKVGDVDPSKLTKEQINEFKLRAMRGERIVF